MNSRTNPLPQNVDQAAHRFTAAVAREFDMADALVFGSQARGEGRPDSDVDIAVLLHGSPGRRIDAALRMASIAFDVLLETGIVIEPLPLWEDEWIHPERFANPALLKRIRREGIVLSRPRRRDIATEKVHWPRSADMGSRSFIAQGVWCPL